MGYQRARLVELRKGIERALAALGLGADARAYDGWLDPAGLAAALEELPDDAPLLLRALPPLLPAGDGYAALPSDGLWLLLDRERGLALAPLRPGAQAPPRPVEAERVVVRARSEPCCDAARCQRDKFAGELIVALRGGEELWIGETMADDRAAAMAPLTRVARPLAAQLRVPADGATDEEARELQPGEPLAAVELGRFGLRREGGVLVLRDRASRGPREAAPRELAMAAALIAAGAAAWYGFWHSWREQSWEHLAIVGAIALVLTVASYAMLHIARWSAKYRERSEALLALARDRLVIAPWVARDGAIDPKPEGRYGAALPLDEVQALDVTASAAGWTLGCRSAHGPYEIATFGGEREAKAWLAALRRAIDATACARRERGSSRPAAARRALAALLLIVGLAGCSSPPPPPPRVTTAADDALPPLGSAAPSAGASVAETTGERVGTDGPPPLRLVEDDLEAAMREAKQAGKAVFVEVWAPWCHTCLSMKSFVLPDPAIRALADRVVFAALDSDRPDNADFLERYSVNAWPTLYVLDSKDGGVIGLWQGAASVEELRALIVSALDARDAALDADGPIAALLAAKRAQAKSDYRAAGQHYQRALERGGDGWARRSEALHGLVFSAYKLAQWERCARLGAEHLDAIEGAALPADASYLVLSCADRVKAPPLAKQARERALARLKRQTDSPPADASVDDRADALNILAGVLRDAGDAAGARAALDKQIALLEGAAAAAPDAEAAATFDYQRTMTYLALGRGEEAVAMLRARARQMPDSYEPPARLTTALVALGRHHEALAASRDAIANSYGPRKLGYYGTRVGILRKLGDRKAERETLEAMIAFYESLEPAHRNEARNRQQVQEARTRLRALR